MKYRIRPCSTTGHCLLVDEETRGSNLSLQMPTDRAEGIVKCTNNHSQLVELLITMTQLCRIKYGNLDEEIWEKIQESEELTTLLGKKGTPCIRT